MAFKFIRTGTGELSGPSMIYQIEQGFDDTAATLEDVRTVAENAEKTAGKALEEANEAIDVSDRAYMTAQKAEADAGAAQKRADEAFNAATGGGQSAEAAMARANEAYDLAEVADGKADSAQAKADKATDEAESAQAKADIATTTANSAQATATDALTSAGTAETTAVQASSDVAKMRVIVDNLESAVDEFEYDAATKSLDGFIHTLVKKFINGSLTSALPNGVKPPFWFYNWKTDTLNKAFQFIQTTEGLYGRTGTPSGIKMREGTDEHVVVIAVSEDATTASPVKVTCKAGALTVEVSKGYAWTTSTTPAQGIRGNLSWDSALPDGTEITIGGRVVAAVSNGALSVKDNGPYAGAYSTISLTGGTVTASKTSLALAIDWTALTATGCTWANWVTLSGSAGLVTIDTAQTISGAKTFSSDITVTKGAPTIDLHHLSLEKGTVPGSSFVSAVNFADKTTNATTVHMFGAVGTDTGSLSVTSFLRAYDNKAASSTSAEVTVVYPTTGAAYATAPETPTEASGNEIATAGWVKAQKPDLSGYVTTDTEQSITGTKMFTRPLKLKAANPSIESTTTGANGTHELTYLNSSNVTGYIRHSVDSTARTAETRIVVVGSSVGQSTNPVFALKVNNDGTSYATAPTPPDTATSFELVTAEWVLSKVGAAGADAVKVTGDQTIAGVKTFTTAPVVPATPSGATGNEIATAGWVKNQIPDTDSLVTTDTQQTITGAKTFSSASAFTNIVEKVQTLELHGEANVNLQNGTVINATVTGDVSSLAVFGRESNFANSVFFILTNGGNYTITWPASIRWPGGNAPTLTANGTDMIMLVTTDNGATWLANYRLDMRGAA